MERLVIIDNAAHEVFIEDVTDEQLEKYNGEEEAYIRDNYTFEGEWTWDYVTGVTYIPADDDKLPMELEPTDWL
jgi:hypothetical protein